MVAKASYGSRWRKLRQAYLDQNPLCAMHMEQGLTARATVVDHRVPHRGDPELFWDQSNWQALCKSCHDSHKQRLEKSGGVVGCTTDGVPIDPKHHWN